MTDPNEIPSSAQCPRCGTQIASSLLVCPGCGRLTHSERLTALADSAASAVQKGDPTSAMSYWREALDCLPPESRQFAVIQNKISELSRSVSEVNSANGPAPIGLSRSTPFQSGTTSALDARRAAGEGPSAKKDTTSRATVGASALAAFTFLITKGKLLLAGLTKAGTFFSMLASMGVYWTAFGWKFAVGLVVSIYIHEMGHVAMLRRYGFKASSPMFIPGVGAVIRLKQHLANPSEDARVGLAGPIWGSAAALAAYLVYLGTDWPSWGAIAHVGAWINLFNLLPTWQLDGGRAFNALTRRQRWLAFFSLLIGWGITHDGLMVLLAIFAAGRALSPKAPARPDHTALGQYVVLVLALSALLRIQTPGRSADELDFSRRNDERSVIAERGAGGLSQKPNGV